MKTILKNNVTVYSDGFVNVKDLGMVACISLNKQTGLRRLGIRAGFGVIAWGNPINFPNNLWHKRDEKKAFIANYLNKEFNL
jgi:hypothetical protein